MNEPHIAALLREKYADMLGVLKKIEAEAAVVEKHLASMEATIRLFDSTFTGWQVEPRIKRKPSRWKVRGGGFKLAVEVMREAGEPLTTREIALAMMKRAGMRSTDQRLVQQIAATVRGSLDKRAGKGLIRHEGPIIRWSIGYEANNEKGMQNAYAVPASDDGDA